MKKESLIFGIDFDGTCVTHEFPNVGKDIGAEPVLKAIVEAGHRLVLWTMRSDVEMPESTDPTIFAKPGQYLTDAVNWFAARGIPLWGINNNPEQSSWTHSPKAYCHIYIDDAAIGCPLLFVKGSRPCVDWVEVANMLHLKGYIPMRPITQIMVERIGLTR